MASNLPSVNPIQTVRGLLEKSKGQIKMALPRHMDADRLIRVALTSIQKTPALLECDQRSLIAAVIESSQLGLLPDGILGHAYLVPYKGKAQLQIGYRGFIELARRSGQVITLYAHAVREGDEYEYELGLDLKLRHVPARKDRGDLIAVYAVVKLRDGGYDFEWMWKDDVEEIRKQSQARNAGPWTSHFEEMAKKTVIRRLAKRLPLSTDFQRAAVHDEYIDAGVFDDSLDIDPGTGEVIDLKEKSRQKMEALKARSTQQQTQEPEVPGNEDLRTEPAPESDQDAEKPQEAENNDPRRAEYINLRSAGFSTWVHKHWNRIHNNDLFSDEHRKEIKEKWAKLYPETTWPVKDGQNGKEQAKGGENGNGVSGGYVFCRRAEQRKPLQVCEQKCSYRSTCEDYAKATGNLPEQQETAAKPSGTIWCPDLEENVDPAGCYDCTHRAGCPSWDNDEQI